MVANQRLAGNIILGRKARYLLTTFDKITPGMVVDVADECDDARKALQPIQIPDVGAGLQKLLESLDILRAGLTALGRRATVTPALMRRALNQEFAEKLSTKHRASLTKAIQKQGSRRLGGGKSKPSTLQSKAWSGDPERDPVLLEAYWEAAKEAGGR
jgi:hypothetical protein